MQNKQSRGAVNAVGFSGAWVWYLLAVGTRGKDFTSFYLSFFICKMEIIKYFSQKVVINNAHTYLYYLCIYIYFFFNFIYLFIYGCVGSSFLCEGFL